MSFVKKFGFKLIKTELLFILKASFKCIFWRELFFFIGKSISL